MLEFTEYLDPVSNEFEFGVMNNDVLIILHRETSLKENKTLFELINTVKSFKIAVDYGNATATFERGYWYISKKILGKLYRKYLGKTERITEALLIEKVRKVNNRYLSEKRESRIDGCQQIRQEVPCKSEPYELAGHQKNLNHLQSNLISSDEELTMCKQALAAIQATYDMNQTDYMILHETLRTVERDRLDIIEQNNATVSKLNEKIDNLEKALVIVCESGKDNLLRLAKYHEEIELAESNLEAKSQVIADKNEEILEVLAEKDEIELKLINFACDLKKFNSVTEIIESYRNFAQGKNKQSHPRYSYLIDFLAEIDK